MQQVDIITTKKERRGTGGKHIKELGTGPEHAALCVRGKSTKAAPLPYEGGNATDDGLEKDEKEKRKGSLKQEGECTGELGSERKGGRTSVGGCLRESESEKEM